MFFKSDTTTNIGFLTKFLPTSVLSTFHNFSVTWCMDDWENQREFYLWMLSTLNFKPYVGILSSYHITSMYISGLPYAIYGQTYVHLEYHGIAWNQPSRTSWEIMSHCFLCMPLFDNLTLSVLVHNSPQIITVESQQILCVKYHMGI